MGHGGIAPAADTRPEESAAGTGCRGGEQDSSGTRRLRSDL
jgi:hypothetical protein